jgi:hypothetical protein
MSEITMTDNETSTTQPPIGTEALIRRYMEIQREIAVLEQEKERLRDSLVHELEGKVPPRWHSVIDGKSLWVLHGHKTTVRYDEPLLKERLGERYAEILEIDGMKVRKNRELVRPLIAPVLDRIGTPAAARVETAIRSGSLTIDAFKGAFSKTVTPYISIRAANTHPVSLAPNVPY